MEIHIGGDVAAVDGALSLVSRLPVDGQQEDDRVDLGSGDDLYPDGGRYNIELGEDLKLLSRE